MKISTETKFLPLQFNPRNKSESWWAPIWRGLVVDPTGKHYRSMRSAVWLYLYLVVHADRSAGTLFRRTSTIAREMGVPAATIRRWLKVLSMNEYVTKFRVGSTLHIQILRWKQLRHSSAHKLNLLPHAQSRSVYQPDR